jgi:hypothetical protein
MTVSTAWRTGTLKMLGLAALLVSASLLLWSESAVAAQADGFFIKSFEAYPADTQAGGHPDLVVKFSNSNRTNPSVPNSCRCNNLKEAKVSLPAGVIGDPHATPQCSPLDFGLNHCPVDSQVGIVYADALVNESGPVTAGPIPVYNLVPLPGQAGLLAFTAPSFGTPTYTVLSARTDGDYGLDAEVIGINQGLGISRFEQTIWGVPADPAHDSVRSRMEGSIPIPGNPANSPEVPFMQNPTTCAGPLESTLTLTAYSGVVETATAPWPATSGCEQLGFSPSLLGRPTTTDADTSSGLDIDLKVPQIMSPTSPTASQIRATTVSLPEGFSINPNAADGKTSCSDAEARFGTKEEAQCPENAKVGTLSILSSALPDEIPGAIYLGEPKPGDRYRLIIVADGFGTHVKLPGSARPDPQTGQLVASFKNLPQAPLSEFKMHFFGSERGLLATPTRCGTYAVNTEFVPWDGELANQTSTQFFKIDSGPGGSPCPGAQRPFKPTMKATGANNGAGSHSPFSITIKRVDGDQNLSAVTVKTPPGFSATLKGVLRCSDVTLAAIAGSPSGVSELASPSCPAASQVGIGWAGAGAGTHPLYVTSKVYLAGPYKGAPLSFAVVTPAVSGPYDLGNVVVRVGINIDPTNAQVTAVSDPLPQIIDGIPLRLRAVIFNLNRPNFTLNPTNCNPFRVDSRLVGNEGAFATPTTHFQTANCDSLAFTPKLTTSLSGSTKRTGFPALKAVLTQSPGQANIGRAAVTLPHSQFLAQEHIRTLCTRVQFAADSCPPASIYGHAKATTPLLDDPLEGPVYLRSSSNKLPDLVAALKGPSTQPVEVELVGRIDSVNERIRTTFDLIPDAAVSRFVLTMQGGKKGLLVNSVNLCKSKNFTTAKITAQNGKKANQNPVLRAPCGSKTSREKRRSQAGRGGK